MAMEHQPESLETITTRLYDAALEGNVPCLLNILQEDPLILDRCSFEKSSHFTQSPLHVAASLNHLGFVLEILNRNPRLAEELDQKKRQSPLHVSSANGHSEIVKVLLAVNPNVSFGHDQDGMNPVHAAAMKGHIRVLGELVRAKPQAAREQTRAGETALHLSVKHGQLECLKFLVNVMDDGELLNFKDSNGNTILHIAVASKQPEMVKFLLKDKRMEKNAINTNGCTAMDTCLQRRKDQSDMEIWRSLKKAKAVKAKVALRPRNRHRTWLENQRNSLMVVASLIATMAFQVGVSPPGGAWQDDDSGHKAGRAIMRGKDQSQYNTVLIFSTIGLVSSLSVILLLISGLPCRKLFVVILMITMWIAVSATMLTYLESINFLSDTNFLPNGSGRSEVWYVVVISFGLWSLLLVILVLGHVLRILVRVIKLIVRLLIKLFRVCFSRRVKSHPSAV